jgi:hypothetical protein
MAGRHKIMGTEKCPNPKCDGFLELGRIRQKTVRNRPGGRYMKYRYFRHNDSNIHEHYVDKWIRPEERHDNEVEEGCSKTVFDMQKIIKRIASFELTEKESIRWDREKEWVTDNVIKPIHVIGDSVNNEQLKNSPEFREAKKKLVRLIGEALLSKDDKWEMGYDEFLFERYDRPLKLERNKKRNKKLSIWDGRPLNDFTGIEPESESIKSKIKP